MKTATVKLRRKPRFCQNCKKPLQTSRTGRWYFCNDVCQAQYWDEHEPDLDAQHLSQMTPTDEDNYGVSMADVKLYHPDRRARRKV